LNLNLLVSLDFSISDYENEEDDEEEGCVRCRRLGVRNTKS